MAENLLADIRVHRLDILQAADRFGVRNLRVFGSVARGEDKQNSDIDFVANFDAKTFDSYMGFKLYLEDLLHRRVDLVMETAIKPRLRDKILGSAINV